METILSALMNMELRMWHDLSILQSQMLLEAEFAKKPDDADNLTQWGDALVNLAHFANEKESKRMLRDAMSKLGKAVDMSATKHEALHSLGNAHSAIGFIIDFRDRASAKIEFKEAQQCFQKAVELCPENERYLQSVKLITNLNEALAGPKPVPHVLMGEGSAAYILNDEPKVVYKAIRGGCPPKKPKLHKMIHIQSGGSTAKREHELHKATIHMKDGLYQVSQQTLDDADAPSSSTIKGKNKSELKYEIFGWVTLAVGLVAWIAISPSRI